MNRPAIQSLRGFACLLLVGYHVIGASPEQGLQIHSGWVRHINDALATVRMQLFGLIAGAMVGSMRGDADTFLRGKFDSLIIPMLTVGTAFAVLQCVMPGTNKQIQDLQLIHLVPVAHYWFLESLFIIHCFFALLERSRALDRPATWLIVFLASVSVYLVHPGIIWFGFMGAVYLLPYYLVGLYIVCFKFDISLRSPSLGKLLILAGFLLTVLNAYTGDFANRFTPLMLATGMLFAIGLWFSRFTNGQLARLGDFSYAIFLFHVFFTAGTRIALNAINITSIPVHFVLAMVAGVFGPMVIHHAVSPHASLRKWLLGQSAAQPKQQQKARREVVA
jgi:surface polysaccharide O-acyltransferase-like enzyme